jgi:hypothetical protein
VKSAEEIMNILEAYDLTGSLRDAAELAGCPHTSGVHAERGGNQLGIHRVDQIGRASAAQQYPRAG